MAKKEGIDLKITVEPRLLAYFEKHAPRQLNEAREKAIEAAGMVWADETKELTTAEDHIDTGLYVNSIGYSTGTPSNPLYEMKAERDRHVLTIGADVAYAESLEKRFALMSRGLDRSENRMIKVAEAQVRKALGL